MNLKLVTVNNESLIPKEARDKITRALRMLPVEVLDTDPVLDYAKPAREGSIHAQYEPAHSPVNPKSYDLLSLFGIHRRTTFVIQTGLNSERYIAAFRSEDRMLAVTDKKEGLVFMIS